MKEHLLKLAPLAMLVSMIAACSDEPASQQPSTPDAGQACEAPLTSNPITGKCGAPESPTDMTSSTPDLVDVVDMHSEPPVSDMQIWPDLPTSNPMKDMGRDMASGDDDMGMDEADMPAPVMQVTRFVAIGDTGTGSDIQRQVGQAIGTVCAQYGGCEFGMLLGDNAYNSGVESENDPFFMDIFVTPYGHLNFPFYVVLGNHDLGGNGLGLSLDFEKGDYQVRYSQINPQWLMPAKFYQVDLRHIWLLALNTTEIFFGQDSTQRGTIPDWIEQAPVGDWKIAFGHHPYISNGKHGNAGEYDGVSFLPIASGEHVETFMEDFICGKVDLYISGHDHSLQDLHADCGTEFIVTGAGAKTTEIKGDNPAYFNASTYGFTLLEATPSELHIYFFDKDANLLHDRVITR